MCLMRMREFSFARSNSRCCSTSTASWRSSIRVESAMFYHVSVARSVKTKTVVDEPHLFTLLILLALVVSLSLRDGCLVPAPEDAEGRILESEMSIPLHPMPFKHLGELRVIQASLKCLFIEYGDLHFRERPRSARRSWGHIVTRRRLSLSLNIDSFHTGLLVGNTDLRMLGQDHARRTLLAKLDATNGRLDAAPSLLFLICRRNA